MRSLFTMMVVLAVGVAWRDVSALEIRGQVIAGGGISSPPATNGVHRLVGTLGQPAVGLEQNATWAACSGFWCFSGPWLLSVGPGGALPKSFYLSLAAPNPAHDQVRFDLWLPEVAVVSLTVFDVSGRQVGPPVSQRLEAGEHVLEWRGSNTRAGIYFARIATNGVLRARRSIVLVR
jgi:hypothetical protein